jgi:hypothetical protein
MHNAGTEFKPRAATPTAVLVIAVLRESISVDS